MHYRIFGRTGLKISVIGVGTWQFGGEWGKDFTTAEVEAIFAAAADTEFRSPAPLPTTPSSIPRDQAGPVSFALARKSCAAAI